VALLVLVASCASPAPDPDSSRIVFSAAAALAPRDCTLLVTYDGPGSVVQLAGEFTGWAPVPLPMVLSPSDALRPGVLYGYKLIVDGQWQLDPAARYRKIVGGTMNSALRLPACYAGPELRPGQLDARASGDATVRVVVRVAADGVPLDHVAATLDGASLPVGSWTLDEAAGAIDVALAGLARGKHRLSLRAMDAQGRQADPIDLPFWIEDEPFDYRDGLLYMFMIDRFANGDPTRDQPVGAPVERDADWHGGDLQGALQVLRSGYFESLGVRTIWLSPLNAQTGKAQLGDGNQLYSAYHGYWPVRAHEVEPRLGGGDALHAFVTEAHQRGLRVLLDLINNQVHEDHEYVLPHPGWFRHTCQCGDDAAGCGWSQRPFDCQFEPYLPDIDWTQQEVEDQFIADAVQWIADYDLDGFRVDAVKHVESNSIYDMRAALADRFEQGGARIFLVGETAVGEGDSGTFFGEHFADGYQWIDAYTGHNALDGQFDFPTRNGMADGLVSEQMSLADVEAWLAKAEARYRPGEPHVRFLADHDNPRIASIAARDAKLGCTWASGCRGDQLPPAVYDDPAVYARLTRALTVLYTLPGVPFLYAGDEIATPGGNDPDNRRDMRFGDPLGGVEMGAAASSSAAQLDLRAWARKLGATRAASRALRRGARVTLLGTEADFWVYAYQAEPGEVAVIAVNRGAALSRLVGTGSLLLDGVTSFVSALGTGSATLAGGSLEITLGTGVAAIFLAK
jgi:glycosidase